MNADIPSLNPAIVAVQTHRQEHASELSPAGDETLLEIIRRLERLSALAAELIDINNRLWAKEGFRSELDAENDTLIVRVGDEEARLRLKRADPNVPISTRTLTSGGSYHAAKSVPRDTEVARLRFDLEEKVESYYQSAHRILKLFALIPSLSQIRCAAVTRVRNNLIEHPVGGTLYSFGFGSSGPRVKSMHQGDPAWNDEGLIPNTLELVAAIVRGCAASASCQL